jgi:hypothetical protein
MTKKITILLMFVLPICSFGQTSKKTSESNQISKKSNQTFEEYCLVNAVSYITIVPEKAKSFKVSGELQSLENSKKSSYIDYGVQLKENETQYFKLIGSDKILAVQSLNALRINYSNSKK